MSRNTNRRVLSRQVVFGQSRCSCWMAVSLGLRLYLFFTPTGTGLPFFLFFPHKIPARYYWASNIIIMLANRQRAAWSSTLSLITFPIEENHANNGKIANRTLVYAYDTIHIVLGRLPGIYLVYFKSRSSIVYILYVRRTNKKRWPTNQTYHLFNTHRCTSLQTPCLSKDRRWRGRSGWLQRGSSSASKQQSFDK